MWDYYGVNLPTNKNTSVSRKQFQATSANYSGVNPGYDVSRRGITNYYTSFTDNYQVVTEYLQQGEADWLSELLESEEVFVQQDVNGTQQFVPVIITNSNYTWKTNNRGQKVFQYTIQYQYANPRFSR